MARVQPVTCFKAIIGLPESLNYKDVVLDNTKCCPEGVRGRMPRIKPATFIYQSLPHKTELQEGASHKTTRM